MDEAPNNTSADASREALASWLRAFNARDLEALIALYDSDSVYANAASPLMRGPEAIRPWFEGAFASTSTRALFREETLVPGEDMCLIVGKFFTQIVDGQPEEDPEKASGELGRVALVLRRSEAGAWRIVFDMDNRPPDVEPADFA